MNRRKFLVVLGSATVVATTKSVHAAETTSAADALDVGPLDQFEENKVYDQFRDQGVMLIRRGDEVFALSSICTHKGCKVRAQDDQSFLCKCHGSRFASSGKVLNGPAVKDLPRMKVKLSLDNHVLVKVVKPPVAG